VYPLSVHIFGQVLSIERYGGGHDIFCKPGTTLTTESGSSLAMNRWKRGSLCDWGIGFTKCTLAGIPSVSMVAGNRFSSAARKGETWNELRRCPTRSCSQEAQLLAEISCSLLRRISSRRRKDLCRHHGSVPDVQRWHGVDASGDKVARVRGGRLYRAAPLGSVLLCSALLWNTSQRKTLVGQASRLKYPSRTTVTSPRPRATRCAWAV